MVYVMCVSEVLMYDEYWNDPRFEAKKPSRTSSRKFAYGDNIYHRDATGAWLQIDSHHSAADGGPNEFNVQHDTRAPYVLIARSFAYWGGSGPSVPSALLDAKGRPIGAGRGHQVVDDCEEIATLVQWFSRLPRTGYLGDPAKWPNRAAGALQLALPLPDSRSGDVGNASGI